MSTVYKSGAISLFLLSIRKATLPLIIGGSNSSKMSKPSSATCLTPMVLLSSFSNPVLAMMSMVHSSDCIGIVAISCFLSVLMPISMPLPSIIILSAEKDLYINPCQGISSSPLFSSFHPSLHA